MQIFWQKNITKNYNCLRYPQKCTNFAANLFRKLVEIDKRPAKIFNPLIFYNYGTKIKNARTV